MCMSFKCSWKKEPDEKGKLELFVVTHTPEWRVIRKYFKQLPFHRKVEINWKEARGVCAKSMTLKLRTDCHVWWHSEWWVPQMDYDAISLKTKKAGVGQYEAAPHRSWWTDKKILTPPFQSSLKLTLISFPITYVSLSYLMYLRLDPPFLILLIPDQVEVKHISFL